MPHPRRRLAVLVMGLMALLAGFVAALLSPGRDPVVGRWVGDSCEMTFREDGSFQVHTWASGIQDGHWTALPDPVYRFDVDVAPFHFLASPHLKEEAIGREPSPGARAYRVHLLSGPPEVNEEGVLILFVPPYLMFGGQTGSVDPIEREFIERATWWFYLSRWVSSWR